MKNRLEVTDVSLAYGKRTILEHISFTLAAGEAVALCGENGSGKTTLLTAAAGILRPARGKIKRNGKVGYVPQSAALAALLLLTLFLTALSAAASQAPLGAALPCALGGVCLFLCGGLLPLHLLPPRVAALGAYTPLGAACDLLAPLFGGAASLRAAAVLALYAAAAAVFASRRLCRLVYSGGLTV